MRLNKLKHVLQILVGILLLIAALSLVFTTSGKELQQTLFGSYVAEDATVVSLYIEEHKQRGKSDFQHWRVYLQVTYRVDDIYYYGSYYDPYYEYKDAKMFVRNFIKAGEHLTIYRDPKKPQKSVWHKEDELHLWLYIFVFLPLLTFSVILIIWGVSEFFSKDDESVIQAIKKEVPVIKPVKKEYKPIIEKSNEEFLADYYSGALDKAMIKKWDGYYCQIFLLKELIVVIYDESKFHRCQQYYFSDFLNKNMLNNLLIEEFEIQYAAEILTAIKARLASKYD